MKSIPVLALLLLLGAQAASSAAPSPSPSASAAPGPSASPSPPPAPTPPVIAKIFSVVTPRQLIVLLPDPPPGWGADKPDGSTSDSTGFAITTVGCVYVDGTADNASTATVNIIDSANNQQFQDATKAMWSGTSSTPEGYDKTVSVNGLPGFEHYANATQTGALWVVVAGRFFVQVETTRLPATDLEDWLGRIDLKRLSTLK